MTEVYSIYVKQYKTGEVCFIGDDDIKPILYGTFEDLAEIVGSWNDQWYPGIDNDVNDKNRGHL